ncbi:MAG: hypothetical protein AABX69_00435, partial [Nanoarchaeota archaeon]
LLFSNSHKISIINANCYYTFQLQDGKVKDITNGLDSNVDFKITTNWDELKNLIVLHKEGNTVAGMNTFWNLDMPLRVKLQVASKIGISR